MRCRDYCLRVRIRKGYDRNTKYPRARFISGKHDHMAVNPKILIVDDDRKILGATKDILAPKGYTVRTAGNGKEGLAAVDEEEPDLVITDISMPDMEGIEFIRKLAQRKLNIPIIAMSGNPIGKQFMQAAVLFGAVDTLSKPFTGQELTAKVNKALSLGQSDG